MESTFTCRQTKNRCSILEKMYQDFPTSMKRISTLLLFFMSFYSAQLFGQAANIDQIRNGPATDPSKNFYSTFNNPEWINGNAGASNAHYVEGMSIGYRSLITGVTSGNSYEYIIEYDTKHSDAMAIDYLTHYQRLEPHGPFGHPAEVIDPRIFKSGSKEYLIGVVSTNTFPILAPSQAPANTPVAGMPQNSFNALPAAQRLMTILNGSITDIAYITQQSLTTNASSASTRVKIRFTAADDSVVLAWGGHIASRLDWGYTNPPTNTIPRSAGGISGSPYHMRHISMNTFPGMVNISLGNQDRSLSAAAVVPPPVCPTVPSQTKCLESTSFTFTIATPEAGATYTWSFGTNTVNAAFQGGVNTGNSVTIIHSGGGSFTTGGSFTLNITALKNAIPQECIGVATGTVVDVAVDAQDADNAYSLNLNISGSQSLGIQSISPGTTADYNFQWKIVSNAPGGNSSITNATSENATFNVLSPYALGVYTVRVIATQKAAPFCSDSSDVTIDVTGGVTCNVNGPATVCPGSQDNGYFYDPNTDGIPDALPANFTAVWSFDGLHPSAAFDGSLTGNSVKVDVAALGSSCGTSYTVKLTLTSTSGLVTQSCSKAVNVSDTEPPVITACPADMNLECGASTDPSETGEPTFTDNCHATASYTDVTVANCNRTVISRTWSVTDYCGNTTTCIQTITIKDNTAPVITCPADKTGASALVCGASILPANTGTASATDNCSAVGDIIIYYKDVPVVNVPCGGITRTWYAVDKSGNESSCVQNIAFEAPAISRTAAPTTDVKQAIVKPVVKANSSANTVIKEATTLQVQAFPNPFTNQVTFRFASPVTGRATLEVFNIMGQKLDVIYEGSVKAGVIRDVQYDAKKTNKATLIYKLKVNDKTVNGKLIQQK